MQNNPRDDNEFLIYFLGSEALAVENLFSSNTIDGRITMQNHANKLVASFHHKHFRLPRGEAGVS
jgi:hypothetical protein